MSYWFGSIHVVYGRKSENLKKTMESLDLGPQTAFCLQTDQQTTASKHTGTTA